MKITPNKHKRLDILEPLVFKKICNLMHLKFQCMQVTYSYKCLAFFLMLFPIDV